MNNEEKIVPNPDDIKDIPPAKQKKKTKKHKVLNETELNLKKARKTRAGIAAFVLILAVGVVGNWYYENGNLSETVEPLITATQQKTLGEAEYVDATTTKQENKESEYFSTARLDRQSARDEALEKLQSIINNTNETDKAKDEASKRIAQISAYISIENKIETLVTAKGVNNCLAVISDDGSRVDVIVDVEELNDTTIMQIKEIAMEQLGVTFENVSIIQSNK